MRIYTVNLKKENDNMNIYSVLQEIIMFVFQLQNGIAHLEQINCNQTDLDIFL